MHEPVVVSADVDIDTVSIFARCHCQLSSARCNVVAARLTVVGVTCKTGMLRSAAAEMHPQAQLLHVLRNVPTDLLRYKWANVCH